MLGLLRRERLVLREDGLVILENVHHRRLGFEIGVLVLLGSLVMIEELGERIIRVGY